MPRFQSASLLTALFLSATRVAGHGHVTNIVVNGVSYEGFDINTFPYMSDPPVVAAWTTPNTGNGFIAPDAYGTADIICHENATNAKGHVVVAAGDKINIQWTAWPDSHHGPVINYLANCGDSCETVDKTTLKFFKIDGVGLVDDTTVPGTWGADQLISNNNSWLVEIPPTLAPGNYVLRHEIIALHSAGSENGAQNYPQCFNLQVTGTGTESPTGVVGTELYSETDAGILVNIYQSLSTYEIPGPTLISGAVSISQSTSAITASGSAVTGSATAIATPIAASTTSAAAAVSFSAAASSAATASVPAAGSSQVTTGAVSLSTVVARPATTLTTVTSPAVITSAPATISAASGSDGSVQSLYGQCGGINWTGPTACASGSSCTSWNPYYYQCVATAA
ncbi:hypothetical protein VTN77DRAFT_9871 [Rasamsonia byssochlamydoides]|uniref:uncharacterized protein n=1 Tax=Rasamsonia byssochlamydoides TaxID=89139 RepID=UPI00085F07D9